ncbi:thioredoxin family protein [Pedobacter metabolipauper]|uniref:Thioredoxin-like protein n=1 Tax=Pedobacter metabolipauper TaxID=425513 RepID=A0A4R6SQY1_9SPHI|nr:thioredoxin family protein [Pedobacter metabolipauper]TDQ06446.1 thioredoxin-like protein [Pedobacter metabolipauper]
MRTIGTVILVFIAMQVSAQKINKTIEDPTRNKKVMLNICTREGLVSFPEMKERYDVEYPNYKPDSTVIQELKPLVVDKKITIVLGTWCGDSKLQVPHFFKVMDELAISGKDVTIICVDGQKKAENGLLDNLNIERVPTIIFYEAGKEKGRIIETPAATLEKDMLSILTKK